MRSATVCKFGGSSLADADGFRRVGDIICSNWHRRYIVVSAPGKRTGDDIKITDLLLKAAESQGQIRQKLLENVRDRFIDIARALDTRPPSDALDALDSYAAAGRDAAASRGEYICALIMAEYLDMPFIDAAELFVFHDGALDISATYARISGIGPSAVIPGFYGADAQGRIVTFPRGGSDVTGAHIAAATGACLYENWTDVDGFFTADPHLVPDARRIRRMSCAQAKLFTSLGAGVLHFDSIAPAADAGVPICVMNTFAPELPGTLICAGAHCEMPCIAAITSPDGSCAVSCANLSTMRLSQVSAMFPGGRSCDGIYTIDCPCAQLAELARTLHRACMG